jgi:hypothetical protein
MELARFLRLIRFSEDLHFILVEQESVSIENSQTHSFAEFIHRNGSHFSRRIQSITEILLGCFDSSEKERDNLLDIARGYRLTPIARTERRADRYRPEG